MTNPFVHLHVHSHYSMLDGACRIPDLVKRAKTLGMDTLAISDHGVMHGAIEFYNTCRANGIKPIIGIEAYMAPGDRRERSQVDGESAYHLLLLAQNLQGYKNLIKLSSISYREGFYYKARIDKAILKEYGEGIIATSACLGGEVANHFIRGRKMAAAKAIAETYLDIFGPDRFFIEVQKHVPEQDAVNPELAELADKVGVGLVGTNDVHFLTADDHHAHACLCCISTQKLITDETRMNYSTELYLKSPEQMREVLKDFPNAFENTNRIAQMCDLELDFSKRYAPVYRVPPAVTDAKAQKVGDEASAPATPDPATPADENYLRDLCEKGLLWRFGTTDVPADVRKRLDYEISIIAMKGFCSYFLIVWDFCNFARENGIPVGARGSGVGTMVGYLLGLCNVNPLTYSLLFERFMDPSRNEMPDIDIDICQDGRQKVIEYVRNKYGHVAQIITFGTLAAKAACKDVGRVMGVSLAEIDQLTKLIPGTPGMTIERAFAQVPDLKLMYESKPHIGKVVDVARRLEGLCRNAGVHAAGVIIADQSLDEIIPLCRDKENNVLTQYEGPVAEKCGLLKMDFLGLRTLSVLTQSIALVRQTRGKEIDIEQIDLTDRRVLELFSRGETKGVFQFESGGMQDLLMKMKPDRIEDLIAANALYRPGPMELIPSYCDRKHGREQVPDVHPIMDDILRETYGIMVYQEQVMQIFNGLGGIDLANAYKLIKAISKKTSDVIAKFKPAFMEGAIGKGVSEAKAKDIFDLILKFGGYGFNKSHSSRYAIVAFQTAYMKTYYPVEYMAALLTYEIGSTDKMVEYIEEARRMKIEVLPPDVNVSDKVFTPVFLTAAEQKARSPKSAKSGSRTTARSAKTKAGLAASSAATVAADSKTVAAVSGTKSAASAAPEAVIRFGLCAVRGVGEKAVENIIDERAKGKTFDNLYDFCERIDTRSVQKSTVDALIRCGAFASFNARRSQLLNMLEGAYDAGQRQQEDKRSGQIALFGLPESARGVASESNVTLPDVNEFEPAELLKMEKELLGFYITSHPLTEQQALIERYTTASTRDINRCAEGAEVLIGGMITAVKSRVAKSGRSAGQKWAVIDFEDLDGKIEGIIFSEAFAAVSARHPGLIKPDSICFLKARVDRKRESPCLIVSEIISMTEAVPRLTTAVLLKLDSEQHNHRTLETVKPLLLANKGSIEVYAQLFDHKNRKVTLRLHRDYTIRPDQPLVDQIEQLLGSGNVEMKGAGSRRIRHIEQQKLFAERSPTEEMETGRASDTADPTEDDEESAIALMDSAVA